MRDRKKRNIIIASLCCLLVFMATGYALLKQVLNINGTASLMGEWKIRISDISVAEVVGTAANIEEKLSYTDTQATFGVNLVKPGDKIIYKVTVVNEGSIDAVLSINSTSSAHEDIKFVNTLTSGEILYGSGNANGTTKLSTKEFYVTAEFNEHATQITSETVAEYSIELIYTQYDGNDFYEPPKDIETDNGVFQVSADGTIVNYNSDLGDSVSIPAEIDGVAIKSISSDAFKDVTLTYNYDFKAILDSNEQPVYAVIFNEERKDEILAIAEDFGLADIYMVGDPDIPGVGENQIEGYLNLDTGLERIMTASSPGFLGESTANKKLNIKSLDLSSASNLETIEDFAFTNLPENYLEVIRENNFDSFEEVFDSNIFEKGLTSLKFGNNYNEIDLGSAVFAFSDLDELKVYTTIASAKYVDKYSLYDAPFIFSDINTLIIEKTPTVNNINYFPVDESQGISKGTYNWVRTQNLIIKDGIVGLGSNTFAFSIFENISLPTTLTSISHNAFVSSTFNELTIPDSVTLIDTQAFNGATFNVVNIPSSVTTIEDFAFGNAKSSSIININRENSNGMTLGTSWSGNATVNYTG